MISEGLTTQRLPDLSGSVPSGGPGAEPSVAESFCLLEQELDELPPRPRFDHEAPPARVKLETRGVTSHQQQGLLWRSNTIFKESIVAKLLSISRREEANKLGNCHTQLSYATCGGCQAVRKFYNRCELFFCPECQPRLSAERKESIEWWTHQATQPKHVVLTVRNSQQITKDYVKWFKACWSKLRRSKFARNWEGGFYSLEVTNEGKGWHLHLHAIVEAKWIDAGELARQWARCVAQDFAIVKVKDCRQREYLKEVTKYAVKGSELAGWPAADIAAFIDAFKGVRTFGVFGVLYGKRTEWREWLDTLQSERGTCTCGCNNWTVRDEHMQEWHEATFGPTTIEPPAPVPAVVNLDFNFPAEPFRLAFVD